MIAKHKQYNRGATLLMVTVLFTAVSMTILLGTVSPIVRQSQMARDFESSKRSYFAAEALGEDAFYRMKNSLNISFPLVTTFDNALVTVTSSPISSTESEIESQAVDSNNYRTVLKGVTVTEGFSFHYGVQTGLGGLYLYNNSSVNGNVYSNGVVVGGSTNSNSYNIVNGSVISAGPAGSVRYINASTSAYANTLRDSIVGTDAYYQTLSNVTVGGAEYPGSEDQPIVPFSITDEQIAGWEEEALLGGSVTCTAGAYNISSSVTIGLKRIPCNLNISGNDTVVTLTGAIWVRGNISIGGGAVLRVADEVGNKSVVMVADNTFNKNGSGLITISGNSNFYGSTNNSDSYVMLISGNTSSENGGSAIAIDVINGATGNLLVYAPHGEVQLQNNVNLREVTAYKLTLYNNSVVNYNIGLAQPLFTSGPGGAWKIKRWKEVE